MKKVLLVYLNIPGGGKYLQAACTSLKEAIAIISELKCLPNIDEYIFGSLDNDVFEIVPIELDKFNGLRI